MSNGQYIHLVYTPAKVRKSGRELWVREVTWNGKVEYSRYSGTLYDSFTQARATITHYDSSGDYTEMGSKSFSGDIGSVTVCRATSGGSITALGR